MNKPKNTDLQTAKRNKDDEFYTQLFTIEDELRHYTKHFKNKVVLCNCDDPRVSNFFHFFSNKFEELGLKKLITTCYKNRERDLFSQNKDEKEIYLEYFGDKNGNKVPDPEEIGIKEFEDDGDFRSEECISLLKEADIVVTNPPFSLWRPYVTQLLEYKKKFLIIGNQNAISTKEIFPYFLDKKIWIGASILSGDRRFGVPKDLETRSKTLKIDENGNKSIRVARVRWFTNLDFKQRHEDLDLYKKYNKKDYPKYDNFNAIHIEKTEEIPFDYKGMMGVPISFAMKHNPAQFEILGIDRYIKGNPHPGRRFTINGKEKYARIIIKNKRL